MPYKNPNDRKVYGEQWRANHKAEIAKHNKQYWIGRKVERAEYNRQYYQDHKVECIERSRQQRAEHPLHGIWNHMNQRCYNPNCKDYKYYGGRGITICDEWLSCTTFEKWGLANSYRMGLTIDKIDNDGNYCPENCHFVTQSENIRH